MAFDLEEQEKIDQVKAWWDKFGGLVTAIVTVILLIYVGYYGWGMYQNYQSEQALAYYDTVNIAVHNARPDANDKTRIQEALATLQKDYPNTAYPARASLLASKYFMEHNDVAAAQQAVEWVIKDSKATEMIPVAQLQLATILLNQGKYDDALSQLNNPPVGFEALFLDRQGDILFAKEDKVGALKAWKEALSQVNVEANFVRLVEMKITVLGGEQK